MKPNYSYFALSIYIIPTTKVFSVFNSHSEGKENELTFDDPKVELRRSRTSGEEKFITSQKIDGSDKLIFENHGVYIDVHKSNDDSAIAKIESISDELHLDSSKQLKHFESEFLPLSKHYDINSTTKIDQATYARIKNSAMTNYNNRHESNAGDKALSSSCYLLGLIYFFGLIPTTNTDTTESRNFEYNEAISFFTIASNAGHSDAQCALALFYYRGCDANRCKIVKDIDKAIHWFSKAVKLKNTYAHWLLGRALLYEKYWHGKIEENEASKMDGDLLKEIITLFQVAIEGNIPEAMHHLALLYEYDYNKIMQLDGYSSFNPIEKAVALYRKAMHLSYHESAYNLALIFTYGRDGFVAQDLIFAMELFRYAATQHKHIASMRYLGIFAINNGLFHSSEQQDYNLALFWYRNCLSTPGTTGSDAEKYARDLCRMELKELLGARNAIEDKNRLVSEKLMLENRFSYQQQPS